MHTVHVVVPDSIDDPGRPSGGNRYDRRLCDELTALGFTVCEHAVPGAWPQPDAAAERALAAELASLPDGETVLVDGLIGSAAPAVVVPESRRLRLIVLVHMPLEDDRERAVLTGASAVVTTSEWTRRRLVDRYALRHVHVAVPGADLAEPSPGTPDGNALLCVAAVSAHKGHDLLAGALARLPELSWRCKWVGALDRDPAFVRDVSVELDRARIVERVELCGPLTGSALEAAYAAADVLVLASRAETYGMVVTEALAHGLPVIATDVGGVPEALGATRDGGQPGLLVPPEDPAALADALRRWLLDSDLRGRLRQAAGERRRSLPDWGTTAQRVASALRLTR